MAKTSLRHVIAYCLTASQYLPRTLLGNVPWMTAVTARIRERVVAPDWVAAMTNTLRTQTGWTAWTTTRLASALLTVAAWQAISEEFEEEAGVLRGILDADPDDEARMAQES